MDPLAASLARSPDLFPQAWDPASDTIRLIRLTEAEYRRASFLDGRILTPRTVGRTTPWETLRIATGASDAAEDCAFIFHIGHAGSTLLSRLLGEHGDVLPLREPTILRTLAQTFGPNTSTALGLDLDSRLSVLLKLWSRTFHATQRACIKATSFASELAASVLRRPTAPKAIFVFVPAEVYLATILGAPNSPLEIQALAESRLKRLQARLGTECWRSADLSLGEMVAMSWACEMSALSVAAEVASDRVLWLNFERFLEHPAAWLAASFRHLGHDVSQQQVDRIISGPELRRYSKAPEHAFDAQVRAAILKQARQEHAAEITRGLAWLDASNLSFPKSGVAIS